MDKDTKSARTQAEVPRKGALSNYKVQKTITTITFMLIPLLLLIVLTYIPATNMLIYSFQDRTQFSVNDSFVGFDNYLTVFSQPEYFRPLLNSLYYLAGSFIQLSLALLLASIICSKVRFANIFKGFIFFPYMINGVAIALIFVRFFQLGDGFITTDGALNSIIKLFGGEGVKFLSDPLSANISLVFVSIWRYIGFDFVMFMGAIQSISPDLYEASDLDGANSWQRFQYIVFPSIRPIIGLQMILAIKGAISVFEIPYIMTGGKFGTSTFVIQTIETAFKYNKVGLASAMAIILLAIIIIVTVIQKLIFREEA
ncbi:MAG: sugar ABC transporter permease [Clostridiales bacterium]|nr:sugar ABC transporter permease [Clostridiales bacterium]